MYTDEKEKKLAEMLEDSFEMDEFGQALTIQYVKAWADKSKLDKTRNEYRCRMDFQG